MIQTILLYFINQITSLVWNRNCINIFELWRFCQTQKYKIMEMNVYLNERNTDPESNAHNMEQSACSQRACQCTPPQMHFTYQKEDQIWKWRELKTTECFVLAMKDDDNPRKYFACPEGSCSSCNETLLAFHPWRGTSHFESVLVSECNNYCLVFFIVIRSDPRLVT